jgi:hypothetical protein
MGSDGGSGSDGGNGVVVDVVVVVLPEVMIDGQ